VRYTELSPQGGYSHLAEGEPWPALHEMPRRARKPRTPTPDGLRTMREAAARLGCSVKTLAGHIAAGALRYVVVGHGTKRRRKMLTDAELAEFIANQSRKDSPVCPSTRTPARHSGNSTSSSEVIAFTARQSARPGAKLKR
jgi:hypothetical protein